MKRTSGAHGARTAVAAATLVVAAGVARAECQLPEWPFYDHLGLQEHHVLLADLDADGAMDFVGADENGDAVTVAFGLGPDDGLGPQRGLHGFGPPQVIASFSHPRALAAGDLDRNGQADLVVAALDGVRVEWNFVARLPSRESLFVEGPNDVVIADMTGDGFLDLVLGGMTNRLAVYPGDGAGGFGSPLGVTTFGASNYDIDVADVDGVNGPDVVAGLSTSASVFFNTGNGQLLSPVSIGPSFDQPVAVATGDLDRVNGPDLVMASRMDDVVQVFLNQGGGTFAPGPVVTVEEGLGLYASLFVADLDGDGLLDVALQTLETVLTWRGNGAGGLGPPTRSLIGTRTHATALADRDADGDLDLTTADDGHAVIRVALNDGTGAFGEATPYFDGDGPGFFELARLDGDAIPDLLVAVENDWKLSARLGDGVGGFGPQVTTDTGTRPDFLAVADVDGDGVLDACVAGATDRAVRVFRGAGGGTFFPGVDWPIAAWPRRLAVADVDGASGPDLIVTHATPEAAGILFNQGGGAFGAETSYPMLPSPLDVVAADFDGVNGPDLLTTTTYGGVMLRRNLGGGSLGPQERQFAADANLVAPADLDGDGDLDLAVIAGRAATTVLNDGTGTFTPTARSHDLSSRIQSIRVADVDGVLGPDVVVANDDSGDSFVAILLNDGRGGLDPPRRIATERATPNGACDATAADLDGDGAVELVVTGKSHVTVFRSCFVATWLLRNDDVRALTTAEVWSVFGVRRGLDLTGPDGIPTQGAADDDDALVTPFDGGGLDPDPTIGSDPTRPLVFYEVSAPTNALKVRKGPGTTLVIEY